MRYRILFPNADMVAAIESTWKRKGAVVAPVEGEGRSDCAPTGAVTAGRGAVLASTGAVGAPESVRESASEGSKAEPAQPNPPVARDRVGSLGSSKSAGRATPKADALIEQFVLYNERAMPAGNKVRQEIEAMLEGVTQDVIGEALTKWSDRREAGFSGLKDPARAMLKELPAFIKLVRQR